MLKPSNSEPSSIDRQLPLLLLISFDGFRFDLLNQTLAPNLWKFAKSGARFANGVRSQYVTVTTPNHLSIVTGLYEESHGIVGNQFYDPILNERFDNWNFSETAGIVNESMEQKWFTNVEPIWLANERENVGIRKSGCLNWPLCAAHFPGLPSTPTMFRRWKELGNLDTWKKDMNTVLSWFTRDKDPLNFVAWYIAQPDETLHEYGFNEPETRRNLTDLDNLIGYMVARIDQTNLADKLNIILTADHGHIEIDGYHNIICLPEYVDTKSEHIKIAERMIYILNGDDGAGDLANEIYSKLKMAVEEENLGMKVWRKKDFPDRYHYKGTNRVGDIIVMPEPGWGMCLNCTAANLSLQYQGKPFHQATHGHDPDDWRMRPVLIGVGPAFSEGAVISSIPENIDLFPLMCHLLQLEVCPSNNGSMQRVSAALRSQKSMWRRLLPWSYHALLSPVIVCAVILPFCLFCVYLCRVYCCSKSEKCTYKKSSASYSKLLSGGGGGRHAQQHMPLSADIQTTSFLNHSLDSLSDEEDEL